MCSVVINKLDKINDCFEETKRMFSQMTDLKMENPVKVGGTGCYTVSNIFKENNSLVVGESSGIQDFFVGFGIRSSIVSGNLAAVSIIQNKDYEKMAKASLQNKQRASLVIRFLWERAGYNNYSLILSKAKGLKDIFGFLYSYSNFNLVEKIIYPLVYIHMKLKSRI